MRYIRFIKAPAVTVGNDGKRLRVSAKITITSDLGDSFFPYDVELHASIIAAERASSQAFSATSHRVVVRQACSWKAGMQQLAIEVEIPKQAGSSICSLNVGHSTSSDGLALSDVIVSPNKKDALASLFLPAWSATFTPEPSCVPRLGRKFGGRPERETGRVLVQAEAGTRRILQSSATSSRALDIWESGSSYAAHVWDAGLGLAAYLDDILSDSPRFSRTSPTALLLRPLVEQGQPGRLAVLELGTGCGIVGIQLAQVRDRCSVILTDLADAGEVIERNIASSHCKPHSDLRFEPLDWFDFEHASEPVWDGNDRGYDLIVISDCTYNWDAVDALVGTIRRISSHRCISPALGQRKSPQLPTLVVVAMKKRHEDEEAFFDVMKRHGFAVLHSEVMLLPTDDVFDGCSESDVIHIVTFSLTQA